MVARIISQVIDDLMAGNSSSTIPIKSLKGRMQSKVGDAAQSLSSSFYVTLTIANADDEVFQSSFGFKAQHVVFSFVSQI